LSAAEKRLPAINLIGSSSPSNPTSRHQSARLRQGRTAPITTLSSATEPCRASSRIGAAAASV